MFFFAFIAKDGRSEYCAAKFLQGKRRNDRQLQHSGAGGGSGGGGLGRRDVTGFSGAQCRAVGTGAEAGAATAAASTYFIGLGGAPEGWWQLESEEQQKRISFAFRDISSRCSRHDVQVNCQVRSDQVNCQVKCPLIGAPLGMYTIQI